MYLFITYTTVPIPEVTVTIPNTQTVGQPLTLTCDAVTMRGITSNVDLVWRRDNSIIQRLDNTDPTTMNSTSLVYTDTYTISQLSTYDDGIQYECRLMIRASPVVRVMDTVTLDVTGKSVRSYFHSVFCMLYNNKYNH